MSLHPGLVGRRVVVRRQIPGEFGPSGGPALTDIRGILESWGPVAITVRPDDADPVEVPLADIVAGKQIPPRPPR